MTMFFRNEKDPVRPVFFMVGGRGVPPRGPEWAASLYGFTDAPAPVRSVRPLAVPFWTERLGSLHGSAVRGQARHRLAGLAVSD